MGVLSSVIVSFFQVAAFLWVFTFFPGIPPNLEYNYNEIGTPLPFEGPLEINDALNKAEKLFENELKGPENLEIFKNELYMSVHGGKILKLSKGKISTIIKFGKPCDGLWEEKLCGRPLGFKFDSSGVLYATDAYYGVVKANISTGEITTLVSMNEPIEGKLPMLPNSLDIGKDKSIYWTDSSTTHHLEDGIYIILGSGTGRLLKYDAKKGENEVLIDNLHFPNGVALSTDESFLVVAETAKTRILKYYLKGPKAGMVEVFIENLPGMPDNIKSIENHRFSVSLVMPVDNGIFSLFKLHQFPILRRMIARALAVVELSIEQINLIFNNYYLKKVVHWIGHFESLYPFYKNHVIIVLLDEKGNIAGSLHGTDGTVKCISDIVLFKESYYLGSPYNSYLGMVKRK